MKAHYQKLIIFFIIALVGIKYNYKTINEFPQFIHCWAQSDRYAISLGFLENGGDFFHPQTFVYNKQFPGDFEIINQTTITSVDFPIHDYIVSILMRLFNSTNPWVFKLYELLYSLIGLFYLYKLTSLFTNSTLKSIFIILFAVSSPVFIYYQAGFLPSIPSLANAIIGLYFFFKFQKYNNRKDYLIAIILLTISTLARLPFAIILVAIISYEFFTLLRTKTIHWYKLFSILISLAIILLYYFYNSYLRHTYGSLFLNSLLFATSLTELEEFIKSTIEKWSLHYFSIYHYIIIVGLFLSLIINLILKKIKFEIIERNLFLLTTIIFLGCVLYYLVMSYQFLNHDYYFLDSFYLPILLLLMFLVIKIPPIKKRTLKVFIGSITWLIFIPIFIHANNIQIIRRNTFTPKPTAERFKDSEGLLNALKISKEAKILVINEDGPNNPFILMKRKGYTVIWPDPKKIEIALKWPYDYVVLDNAKLIKEIYPNFPEIKNQLTKIGGNENLSVFIKKQTNENIELQDFLSLNQHPKVFSDKITFETIANNLTNCDTLSNFSFSGKNAGIVKYSQDYGLTYKILNSNFLKRTNSTLLIKSQIFTNEFLKEFLICAVINKNGKEIVFLANDLSQFIEKGKWNKNEILFSLPQLKETDLEFSIFIWNKGKNTVIYDDIELTIY